MTLLPVPPLLLVPVLLILSFAEQLVPTGSGGQGQGRGQGQGQGQQGSRNGALAWGHGSLFTELDQVESRNGTYPSTEGFCCLIQVMLCCPELRTWACRPGFTFHFVVPFRQSSPVYCSPPVKFFFFESTFVFLGWSFILSFVFSCFFS